MGIVIKILERFHDPPPEISVVGGMSEKFDESHPSGPYGDNNGPQQKKN